MNIKTLPTLFIQAALVTTAAVLALVLITKYVAPIPLSISQTTTQKETSFNVSGKSTITTVPDKAVVTLGISQKEASLKEAQSTANTIINTLQQKLADLGIKKEDIKTQNYNINPSYDYQKGGQNIIGYSVDITLAVNLTDFDKVNQVIDSATSIGINQVSGVQFTLSDEKEAKIKADARREAIADAQRNANELAGLAGMRLGKIINIVEGSSSPGPRPYFDSVMSVKAETASAPTNIQPGSTTYTYTVTLSYETL